MAETAAVAGLRRTLGDGNPSGNRETRRPPAATPATPPVAAWKAARPAFTAMAVGALNTMMLTRVQVRFGRYLSRRYMTGVLDREFPFFVNRSSGDLIYRANLVMVVEQIVTGSLPSTVVSMVFLVVYLIMMIAYSAPLTMLTLTVCAAVLVVSVIYSLRNRTLVERATVAQADVQRAFIETFSGIVGVISQIMAFATYMRKICEMIPAGEGDKIAIVGPRWLGQKHAAETARRTHRTRLWHGDHQRRRMPDLRRGQPMEGRQAGVCASGIHGVQRNLARQYHAAPSVADG